MPIASRAAVFGKEPEPPTIPKRIETVAEPKAKPKKAKKGTRADIKLSLMAEMMDGTVQESEITVANPSGCISPNQVNDADHIFALMKAALAKKLGVNHVK